MKFFLCACTLFSLFLIRSAQYNRPYPMQNRQQQPFNNNFLNMALLLGLDFNDIMAFQAVTNGQAGFGNYGFPNFGLPVHPIARQRATQNLNTLAALGIIDGPDVPDGPVKGKGKGKGKDRRRGGKKSAAVKGGAGAAGAEAPEGAPAKKPRRRGPRRGRKRPSKTANAKK